MKKYANNSQSNNEMTNQPEWKTVANLGDANPLEHGGFFVQVDATGVYDPEAVLLIEPEEDEDPQAWTEYRFVLEPCTYQSGAVSDNPFHPNRPAWFSDDLDSIAEAMGTESLLLINDLCSKDPISRARGYQTLVAYYGPGEFDQYPHPLNEDCARALVGRLTRLRSY